MRAAASISRFVCTEIQLWRLDRSSLTGASGLMALLMAQPVAASFGGCLGRFPPALYLLAGALVGLIVGVVPLATERVVALRSLRPGLVIGAWAALGVLGVVPWALAWRLPVGISYVAEYRSIYDAAVVSSSLLAFGIAVALCRSRLGTFGSRVLWLTTLAVGAYQGYWFQQTGSTACRDGAQWLAGFGFACGALLPWWAGAKWAAAVRRARHARA